MTNPTIKHVATFGPLVIDEAMLGGEWNGESEYSRTDLLSFASDLSRRLNVAVRVADSFNGGGPLHDEDGRDLIPEAVWNAAIEALPARCWR